ncbi:unnamed protein product, partial [Porites evermanni]
GIPFQIKNRQISSVEGEKDLKCKKRAGFIYVATEYDLLSREDEKDSDQTYVYLSSKLSPLSASEFLFEPPAEEDQSDHSEQNSILVLESDSASDEAGPSTSASKMNTPVRQCVK